jgi:hypothetical protein
MAAFSTTQIVSLAFLFIVFISIPTLVKVVDHSLDSLPMRFASVILVLGALSYDRFIALGLFLVVVALYIQHHHNDLMLVVGSSDLMTFNAIQSPSAMNVLDQGGYAEETVDTMDFTPKTSDQDNTFSKVGATVNEKEVLPTEVLGSKSQSIFREDLKLADAMDRGNRGGYSED